MRSIALLVADVGTVRMFGVVYQFAVVNLVGDSSRTVGCVGESYIVCTVILPQIGELPVHLSIGEV